MPLLTVTVNKIGSGAFNIAPKGPIDSDTYMILQKKIDEILNPPPRFMVFDMKDVDYISSLGIKVVLNAKEAVKKGGGTLVLLNLQPQISKVFDIIKAIPSEHIFASRDEMDRYLAGIQRKEIENRKSS